MLSIFLDFAIELTNGFLTSQKQSAFRTDSTGISFSFLSMEGDSLVLPPPADKVSLDPDQHTAVISLPGCLIKPIQYVAVAKAIQNYSKQAVWIAVPELLFDMANPFTVPSAVRWFMDTLKDMGYTGEQTFVRPFLVPLLESMKSKSPE